MIGVARIVTKRSKRSLGWFLVVLGLLYVTTCLYFWATQREKILRPIAGPSMLASELPANCAPRRLPGPSPKDTLHAFWYEVSEQTPVILFLHGQESTVVKAIPRAKKLNELGYQVLSLEYRGYGQSYGQFQPSEESVLADAEAALKYLQDQGIENRWIILYGHSLGGAVSIALAARHPEVAGVIAESTFTSISDMSGLRYNGLLNLLPVELLLTERFDSHSKLDSLRIPLLLLHGTADEKVPHTMSDRLYQAANVSKQICFIDGAGHANCSEVNYEQYTQAIKSFIADCTAQPNRPAESR